MLSRELIIQKGDINDKIAQQFRLTLDRKKKHLTFSLST